MNSPQTTISVQQFVALTQRDDDLAIIDVRTTSEVNTEYLDGCCNLPLQDLTASAVNAFLVKSNRDDRKPVYFLCGSGQRAHKAATLLAVDVTNPLVIIEGGINAMRQAGVNLRQGGGSIISLERQVRIAAGLLVVLGVALGTFLNPMFYGLSAFVGAGLVFAGVTDTCGMGMALARMPWNRVEAR